MSQPTQAEDGDLDEQISRMIIENRNEDGSYDVRGIAKDVAALKSTWQAEVRREMLEKLPERRIVANPDEHEQGWSRHEAEHFNETLDLIRERLEQ